WVDGKRTALAPASESGLIRLTVPAGEHDVLLRFSDTPLRQLGNFISAGTLLLVVILTFRMKLHPTPWPPGGEERPSPGAVIPWYMPLGSALITLFLLALKILANSELADWFTISSPQGRALPAMYESNVLVAPGIKLLGYDIESTRVAQGDELMVRLYWQATEPTTERHAVFVHLVAGPNQDVFAQSDALHPGNVPTNYWLSSFYVADEHRILVPPSAPAIAMRPMVGLYDPQSGERAGDYVMPTLLHVTASAPERLEQRIRASHFEPIHFGPHIRLLGYDTARSDGGVALTLYWQTDQSLQADYQVFVHATDEAGSPVAQADSSPVQGLYPTSAWLPGQVITDTHSISLPSDAAPVALRFGLYSLTTLARLPATTESGQALPDAAVVIPFPPEEPATGE
ncbi:MAG: hypothetical protein ACRDIB_09540, partial [Ardenticatenaceae bacterium]